MPHHKSGTKSKIQQVVDYLKATGDTKPGVVIEHFKGKGFKVDYGEVRTAKQRAFPEKYAARRSDSRGEVAAAPPAHPNGLATAVITAVDFVASVGSIAAAKQALAVVEKIKRLPS
jgi:hypothetical protein